MSTVPTIPQTLISRIFSIVDDAQFNGCALELFQLHAKYNAVYREFIGLLNIATDEVTQVNQIPCLPIGFFKTHRVILDGFDAECTFQSSGTTGVESSQHHVSDLAVYERSFRTNFENSYGPIEDFCILALLPSYLERGNSSLIYMADRLITWGGHPESGFYLNQFDDLAQKLHDLDAQGQKVLLLGVSFALLDFVEHSQFNLQNTIVMETGGMKGRKKELVREELHELLQQGFGVSRIHSEYGMTELLSQAYSHGKGFFSCPPWMRINIRETQDPFSTLPPGRTGGVNVFDLANVYSCPFIATQDLGKTDQHHHFEILGRFDNSDLRGCSLLVAP